MNYITPVILKGWKGHITMETKITDGRINIRGNIVARSKPKFADYMLYLNDGKPIAVVEAKDNNHSVSYGLQQAMTYAQMMDLPFGSLIYWVTKLLAFVLIWAVLYAIIAAVQFVIAHWIWFVIGATILIALAVIVIVWTRRNCSAKNH